MSGVEDKAVGRGTSELIRSRTSYKTQKGNDGRTENLTHSVCWESQTPPISFAVFKEYLDFVREMREKENTFVNTLQTILDDFVCAGMYSRWETELFDLLERTFYDSPDDKYSSDIEYWVYECNMGEKEGKIFLEEDANGNPAEMVVFKTDEDVYNYLVRMYPSRKARALERAKE